MNHHHAPIALLFGCALLWCRAAPASSPADCRLGAPSVARAQWLQERDETFRAAGVYLEALRTAPTDDGRVEALRCLANLYMDAGQFRRASRSLFEAGSLVQPQGVYRQHLALNTATAAVHAGNPAGALGLLRAQDADLPADLSLRAGLLRGLAQGGLQRYQEAAEAFGGVVGACAKGDRRAECRLARRNLLLLEARPAATSGGLAALLSAVVPGAGFVYTEHYFDALLYATAVGLGAFVTANSWHTDRDALDQRAGTYTLAALTALLYASNVMSSYSTAERLDQVRDHALRTQLRVGTRLPMLPMSATPTSL